MVSINELKKQIKAEKKKRERERAKERKRLMKINEKKRLKKELFNLKNEKKLKTAKIIGNGFKKVGKNLGSNISSASKSFQKQRKRRTGLGGFLQNIADNQ